MNLIRYRAAVGRCQQPPEIPCSLTTRDRKLPCRTLPLLRPILAAFHGSEQTRAECSDFGSFRIPASLAEGLMTTKHSTYVFCDGGDGLTVERRYDGLFIYAVPPFLRYVSQNLIFTILTHILRYFGMSQTTLLRVFPAR